MLVLPSGNEWQFVNVLTLHMNPFLLTPISSFKEPNIRITPKFGVLRNLIFNRQIDCKLKMYYH